jgi:hypothetical protein
MPPTVQTSYVQKRAASSRRLSALRSEVEIRFDASSNAHLTKFGRIYPGGSRYICISAYRQEAFFALYFFHHGHHDWRVYPPQGIGPSIVYWSVESTTPAAIAAPA